MKTLQATGQEREELMKEASVLKSLNHPSVLRFLGFYIENNVLYFVTGFTSVFSFLILSLEYIVGGNLLDWVREKGSNLKEKDLLSM